MSEEEHLELDLRSKPGSQDNSHIRESLKTVSEPLERKSLDHSSDEDGGEHIRDEEMDSFEHENEQSLNRNQQTESPSITPQPGAGRSDQFMRIEGQTPDSQINFPEEEQKSFQSQNDIPHDKLEDE